MKWILNGFLLAVCTATCLGVLTLFHAGDWRWALVPGAVTFAALRWGVPALVMRRVQQVAEGLFEMKSRVLRGATLEVHDVERLPPPTLPVYRALHEDDWDDTSGAARLADLAGRSWYRVELTVRPRPAEGCQPMQCWEPGELCLVSADVPEGRDTDATGDESCPGAIEDCRLHHEGAWRRDEGWKLAGPQRMRLVLAVDAECTSVRLRYYFEVLPEIDLTSSWTDGAPAPADPDLVGAAT